LLDRDILYPYRQKVKCFFKLVHYLADKYNYSVNNSIKIVIKLWFGNF